MSEGDIVEIHEIVCFGHDRWRPAIVTSVFHIGFFVELLDTHSLKAVPFHEEGRQWRGSA